MSNDKELLLDLILQATREQDEAIKTVKVSTVSELLEVAYCKECEVEESEELSVEQQFFWDLYCEVFDEVIFCRNQLQYLFDLEFEASKIRKIEKKQEELLRALERSSDQARKCIESHFQMDDVDTIKAIIYCFASLESQQPNSEYLDRAIIEFVKADPEYHPCFVEGFKHGIHPQISSRLLLLPEISKEPVIQSACLEILNYRDDIAATQLEALLHNKNEEVRIRALLHSAKLKHQESVSSLLKHIRQPQPILGEEALRVCLLNHSLQGLSLCRQICNTTQPEEQEFQRTPDEVAFAIKLLALAGNQYDVPVFKAAIRNQELIIQQAGFFAIGEFGLSESVEELIQSLKQTENEELKRSIAKALERITGACLEEEEEEEEEEEAENPESEMEDQDWSLEEKEKYICTTVEEWQNWWWLNRNNFPKKESGTLIRWRRGKELSLELLIGEMQAIENNQMEREQAWQELVFRSGHHIPFEPDWPINRQEMTISEWKNWLKTEGQNPNAQVWAFSSSTIK